MHVFWRLGYESASLADLADAMGITSPSLYTAFGDKEHLFIEAIDHYQRGPGGAGADILAAAPTARKALERLLEAVATEWTRDTHPPGCMLTAAEAHCANASTEVQGALAVRRSAIEAGIRARLEQGKREGELSPRVEPSTLAKHFTTVIQGMALQAHEGGTREDLLAVGAAALHGWPTATEVFEPA